MKESIEGKLEYQAGYDTGTNFIVNGETYLDDWIGNLLKEYYDHEYTEPHNSITIYYNGKFRITIERLDVA